MALGGLTALIVTPAFALSYFTAYGFPYEAPPRWLSVMEAPLTEAGVIVPGSTTAYDLYGVAYLCAWAVGLAALARVVALRRSSFTARLSRSWNAVLAGMGVVAVGILGDYAIPNDVVGGIGFALTCVGFVATALAFVVLDVVLRRDAAADLPRAWTVASLGAASVIGGTALVGHIPSGPGLGFALAALALAATHRDEQGEPSRVVPQPSS